MRFRRIFGLIGAAALFAAVEHGTRAQGLLENSGLAAPAEGAWTGAWKAAAPARTCFAFTNVDGFSSNDSLEFAADAERPAAPVTQTATCAKNTEYVLTAAMKSDGQCAPVVVVYAPGLDTEVARVIGTASAQWKRYSKTFNSGGADRLEVRLYGDLSMLQGANTKVGKAWFDAVQIFEAGQAPDDLGLAEAFEPPGPNVARGKSYSLKPKPSYGYCTDPGDAVQLTDGDYTAGYFWTQKSTVGWSRAMPVYITIDLGQVEPIAGASLNTAAGTAGVSWPEAVFVMVSDDGKTWRFAGDLLQLSLSRGAPDPEAYSVHRFATDALKTKGRYVQFMVAQTPYCFVDEIEVYRGDEAWLAQDLGGETLTDVQQFFIDTKVYTSVIWRLRSDLTRMRAAVNDAGLPAAETTALGRRADELSARIDVLPRDLPPDFRTVLPLNPLHAEILALNAPVLRTAGLSALKAWQTNRWDPLEITAAPPADAAAPRLDVAMMRGEVRADAVNLTNPTDQPVDVTLLVSGLPGGTNPSYVQVKDVLFTDTASRIPVAAALPDARRNADGFLITVPAGCTKQIWLSFYRPGNLDAGEHTGQLVVRPAARGATQFAVPIRFRLVDMQFPEQPVLSVGGWDYTNGSASYYRAPGNLESTLALLRDHYVDTPWATSAVQPRGGKYGPDGALINADELDFSAWDAWVQRWEGARNYCVFLSVGGEFRGEQMGTARFNRMVGEWITAWVKHMAEQELKPHQLGLLLVDEPHSEEQDRRILTWALPIRQAEPQVVIWEDPTWRDPTEGVKDMFDICTVLCPNTPMMLAQGEPFVDFYREQQKDGRTLWLYSCSGPAKLLDPYAYHRGQKWRAITMNALGSCYWAFGCAGKLGSSWNAYAQPGIEYSPYFVGQASVTDGKHMEAIREGVEDYEYFVLLRNAVNRLERRGVRNQTVASARKLLEDGPRRVTEKITSGSLAWREDKDRSIMDTVRVEVLDALETLRKL